MDGLKIITNAQQWTERKAIISNNRSYSYRELLYSSTCAANWLLDKANDLNEARVCFLVKPSFEYTSVQWGIWRAGGIAVPLCVLHPLPSLQYVIENSAATILIVDDEYLELLSPLAKEKNIRLFSTKELFIPVKEKKLPSISESRPAQILYTSGTTSLPKGVVTTHKNINFQIATLVEAWQWQQDDHILNILPLHHVHGIINVMSCALWVGACCQFLEKFDAAKVWSLFTKGEINLFMAVPTIYYKLIEYWDKADATTQEKLSAALKNFRLMVSGSAALPVPVLEKWRKISGQTLLERYGMTEIGMALSNPYTAERRAGHVGQPLPNVQIRLVNEHGVVEEEEVAGEIQIKGANVFLKYWEKPKATQEAFTPDGWFKSGDIAILVDGYYKILGRDSVDIIKSGGYKISALEIEDILRKHPVIADCAVVGIPNLEWGELIVAALILKNNVVFEEQELKNWLKTVLPNYKMPRKFKILPQLPRNVLGKVTKNELKKLFE